MVAGHGGEVTVRAVGLSTRGSAPLLVLRGSDEQVIPPWTSPKGETINAVVESIGGLAEADSASDMLWTIAVDLDDFAYVAAFVRALG